MVVNTTFASLSDIAWNAREIEKNIDVKVALFPVAHGFNLNTTNQIATKDTARMSPLGAALRHKFASPKEAMDALGLDASLLAETAIVGDSNRKENTKMAAKPLSRKAALVLGAITGHFAPRFAQDKAIDFTPIVAGLTAKNYSTRVGVLSTAALKAVEGRLAMDADAQGLAKLLDALSDASPAEAPAEGKDDAAPVMDPNAGMPVAATEEDPDKAPVAKDDDDADADMSASDDEGDEGDEGGDAIALARSFLASKLSPEDLNHFNSLVAKIGAEGTPAEDAEEPAVADPADPADPSTNPATPPAGENEPGDSEKDKDMIPKSAMDAAIAAALKAENAKNKATAMAKDSVESALGKVVACDSASDYYRLGLKSFEVADVDAMPAVALKPTFDALAAARKSAPRAKPAALAQDASADADYRARFPNAGRLAR